MINFSKTSPSGCCLGGYGANSVHGSPLKSFTNRAGKTAGFTLLEVMMAILIVAILLAIADPSYQYITNSNRIAGEINGLLGDLQFARAEALKEGQTVSVCVSTDNSTCTGGNAWQNGWIVFSDPNNLGAAASGGVTILRVQTTFTSTDTFAPSISLTAISFNRDGFSPGIANGTMISVHDATSNSKWTRCLSITLSGLMAVQPYDGSTCT